MKNLIPYSLTLSFLFAISAIAQHADSIGEAQSELIKRADSLIANYKFENALSLLSRGDGLRTDILLRIGQCNTRLGASSAAILPYERVLQLDSSNITALNQLGLLYSRSGDFEKAYSAFIKLIHLDSTNSYYCKQAGSMAAQLSDKMTARFWFRRTLNLNPKDTEASLGLGNILMEMEQYESVDSIAQKALAVDPQFRPIQMLQVKSSFEQHKHKSVITGINHLLEKSDTTIQLARMLSMSYFNLHHYDDLVTSLRFLLRNGYDSEWICYYMAVATRELGNASTAIKWFNLAVQKSISENIKTYYTQLGQTYEEVENYAEAIRAYRAAYNQSKEGILLYHLARNYDKYYKDKSTALLYYQKYLESEDTIRMVREYAQRRVQDIGEF